VTHKARILRSSLYSVSSLTPLITICATRAAYGPEQTARHQLDEALRHARRLVEELELRQLQLDRHHRESAPA
jgi:hypothetical protein